MLLLRTHYSVLNTDGFQKHLRRMFRFAPGEMFDLLAAGYSRSDNFHVRTGRLDGRRQALVTNGERQVVVFFFKAKGPCHTAAPGIHLRNIESCPSEHRYRGDRSDQRFLMTVAVHQSFAAIGSRT